MRTRVLDLALAIESEDPNAGESAGSNLEPVQATQIFYTTVMGGNVAVGSQDFSQTIEAPPKNVDDLVDRLRGLGLDEQLLTELRDAIREDEQAGESPTHEPGTRTRAWLGKVMMQAAKAGGQVGVGASGTLVAQLVMSLFT